jgi:hypothetical protein
MSLDESDRSLEFFWRSERAGTKIIQRRIEKERNRHGPDDHAKDTKGADPIKRFELEPGYEERRE